MAEDVHYENQRIFCEQNKVPLFAYTHCSHSYPWNIENNNYAVRQSLGEILLDRYGSEEEAFKTSSSTHITGCPGCGRSWCD